jgi:hypothetical protein
VYSCALSWRGLWTGLVYWCMGVKLLRWRRGPCWVCQIGRISKPPYEYCTSIVCVRRNIELILTRRALRLRLDAVSSCSYCMCMSSSHLYNIYKMSSMVRPHSHPLHMESLSQSVVQASCGDSSGAAIASAPITAIFIDPVTSTTTQLPANRCTTAPSTPPTIIAPIYITLLFLGSALG